MYFLIIVLFSMSLKLRLLPWVNETVLLSPQLSG